MKDDYSCLKTRTSSGGGGGGGRPEVQNGHFLGFKGEIHAVNNSLVPLLVFIRKQVSNFSGGKTIATWGGGGQIRFLGGQLPLQLYS